jgi:hypothetical protein
MITARAYAEVERLNSPSLACGSVGAAEIAANGEQNRWGTLPVSPDPCPTTRQAR